MAEMAEMAEMEIGNPVIATITLPLSVVSAPQAWPNSGLAPVAR
jgi:hypothetical protein